MSKEILFWWWSNGRVVHTTIQPSKVHHDDPMNPYYPDPGCLINQSTPPTPEEIAVSPHHYKFTESKYWRDSISQEQRDQLIKKYSST